MKEEDLIKIWKKTDMEHLKINLPLLIAELRNKMEYTDKKIKQRDMLEITASIVGMFGYSFLAWEIPFVWTKVACCIAVIWFAYVIFRLKNTSKHSQPDVALPLIAQLEQRKQYLKKQAQLLKSVPYWYLLPPFIMNVIFFLGVGDEGTWNSPIAFLLPYTIAGKSIVIVFCIVIYGFIARLNLKVAKEYYPPLITEIEQLQDELKKNT